MPRCNHSGHTSQEKSVAAAGTAFSVRRVNVSGMVTKKRSIARPKAPAVRRVALYIREWRKFMGVGAPDVASALEVERESYLRMERETWRVTYAEAVIIADTLGVRVSQLRFPPPDPGQERPESLDEMVEDKSPEFRRLARAAIRGMSEQ